MSDLAGKHLAQYEILSLLGQGGMAIVYKAHQPSMDRDVAIKVISGQLAGDPSFVSRFEREARLIAKLQHPHILPVYDFGRDENVLYLVMRLVEGGALDQRLRQGPLPLDLAVPMFTQIASALNYAHERGIVHRDLKPNNILLDSNNNPYLTDFGIAKMLQDSTSSLTATGTVMGTPSYMAPELWRSETVDARTDIYALGIMLYEMLTGDLPFKGETPYALMYKHLDSPLPSPRTLQPNLPEGIAAIIEKAVAKKPEDRYASADLMAKDLRAVVAGNASSASFSRDNEATFVGDVNAAAPTKAGQGTRDVPGPTEIVIPSKGGRLPLIAAAAGVIVLLLAGGGFFLASQAGGNANATGTQVAFLAPSQTHVAQVAATGTAFALLPTATHTATSTYTPTATHTAVPTNTATATFTASSTNTPTFTPTIPLPTAVRFTDFSDQALNIKFRVPVEWEVQKKDTYGFFVSQHFADLKFADDGTVTGPPYIQVAVGTSANFGALDMANAKTPMDALTAMFGGEQLQNLDPVYGTHFETATTTRINSTKGIVKILYLMILGPDRFAMAALQTTPDKIDDYNKNIAMPLVRSLDFAVAPTEAPQVTDTPTPTAEITYEAPTDFDTFDSKLFNISFDYPKGWFTSENNLGIIITKGDSFNGNDPNSPPYILVTPMKQKDLLNYRPENSIVDLYRDNLGVMSINPEEIQGAPYPSAIGRSLGNTSLKVNGWLGFVQLDADNYLEFFFQAPRGGEDQYRDDVVIPLIQSLNYTAPGK